LGLQQGLDAVKGTVSGAQKDYQKSAQDKIDQLSASIEDLKKKADQADSQARAGLKQTVHDLEAQRDSLQARLDKMKNSTADAWKDMTSGIDQSLSDLQKAGDKAAAQFSGDKK
jgi:chromosome segregation ATPase